MHNKKVTAFIEPPKKIPLFLKIGITKEEMYCLTGKYNIDDAPTFNIREKLVIEYTKHISQTPIKIPKELVEKIKLNFTEREIVIIASTVAQVNYWARIIQALGVPPEGFSDKCDINLK